MQLDREDKVVVKRWVSAVNAEPTQKPPPWKYSKMGSLFWVVVGLGR